MEDWSKQFVNLPAFATDGIHVDIAGHVKLLELVCKTGLAVALAIN